MWKYTIPFTIALATPLQAQTLTQKAKNYCKWESYIAWSVMLEYQDGSSLSQTLYNMRDDNADNIIPQLYEQASQWPRVSSIQEQNEFGETFMKYTEEYCVEVLKMNPHAVEQTE